MKRRVLLCVLDWGLGHAARSLALLRELELNSCEVIVASSGRALTFLKLELPGHVIHELPDYGVQYNSRYSFVWGMIFQLSKILKAIGRERDTVREILRKEKIDIVISDNRYGCFDSSTRSVFLSHHLKIQLTGFWKVFSPLVNYLHTRLISKFTEVWIPDFADHYLSGDLSLTSHSNVTFVGPLSTMRRRHENPVLRREFIAVLSGPEPARTRFSDKLFTQLENYGKQFVLIEGIPEGTGNNSDRRIQHLKRDEVCEMIQGSEILIARSGYSTIMDMAVMGGRAMFVPTPGQSEQLYLAKRMERMGVALYEEESNFDIVRAAARSVRYKGFNRPLDAGNAMLKKAVLNLISDGKVD